MVDIKNSCRDFHSSLLTATLKNALLTSFYQDLWKDIDVSSITIDNFHTLPLIDKDSVLKAGINAQNRKGLICTEIFTSGTTGVPLITVRGNRELEFINRFYSKLNYEEGSESSLIPRGLQINNPYHGSTISIPIRMHFHRIGIYDEGSFDHGRNVLQNMHYDTGVEENCTVLVGIERALRAFTIDTLEKYPNGFPCKLKWVISYTQYLTREWRQYLTETWGCKVVDRFSLSEIFGGATQSPICNWWHFDPCVLPEVISSSDHSPIQEGVGLLVLTALYPFQEAQPMVRYLTGDLVEVTHSQSCRPGNLAIRPLGRARYGVPLSGTSEWLLTPNTILEAIDVIPEVARIPRFRDARQVKDPYVIGHPKYQLNYALKSGKHVIHINLDVCPEVVALKGIDITNSVSASLLRNSPRLHSEIEQGHAVLEVQFVSNIIPDLIAHAE